MDVPKHLLSPEEVEQLVAERQPKFIPLERYGPGSDATPPADSATGELPNALPLLAPSAAFRATLRCSLPVLPCHLPSVGASSDAYLLQALAE